MFSFLIPLKNKLVSLYSAFKTLIENLKNWFNGTVKKHYVWQPDTFLTIIGFLIVYRMVSPFIWDLFQHKIVDDVLSKLCFQPLSGGLLLGTMLVLVWLGSRLYKQLKINGYKTRLFNNFLLILLVVVYWSNRGAYIHYPLYPATLFKYTIGLADPIAIFVTLLTIVLSINLFRNNRYLPANNFFLEDLPIEEISSDEFIRTEYFLHLQDMIRDIRFDSPKAFSIGLNSSWGYGKTSLLIILKKLFEKSQDTVYMDYNPWMSSSKSGLTLDFFVQLEDTLAKHIETDNLIIRYGKALAKIDVSKNPLKSIGKIFDSETSLKERHDSVSMLLQKTNKRFVVIIDDLDRLDNQEVFEVLRLIRNTANFSRMMFVVAYDRGYLINALQKNNVYAPERYLEKIFNLEIILPHIVKEKLSIMLIAGFEKGLKEFGLTPAEYTDILDQFKSLTNVTVTGSDPKYKTFNNLIWSVLRNKRDVIRFTNALTLIYRSNFKYTYLPDLALLEMIKFLDIKFYEEIAHEAGYLISTTDTSGTSIYELFQYSGPTPQPERVSGDTGLYDIRGKKSMQLKLLVEALFQPTSLSDHNHDKAMIIAKNFEEYFIFAQNVTSTGGLSSLLSMRTR